MVENAYIQLKNKTKYNNNFNKQKMIFNEDCYYFNQDKFNHPEVLNKDNKFFDITNELKPLTRNKKRNKKPNEEKNDELNTLFPGNNSATNSNFRKYVIFIIF